MPKRYTDRYVRGKSLAQFRGSTLIPIGAIDSGRFGAPWIGGEYTRIVLAVAYIAFSDQWPP